METCKCEKYKVVIAPDGLSLTFTAPSDSFELMVKGTAGTITIYRSADGINYTQLEDTYDGWVSPATSDSISMFGFSGRRIKLETTGTFTEAFITKQ